jgi:YD repeat-containing protein
MRFSCFVFLCLCLATPALAQTERRYDDRGRFIGRAETQGGTTRFHDNRGRYTGRAETRGGRTRFYDDRGRFIGRGETRTRR